MLIEQMIEFEFELSGLGPTIRTCTLKSGYFHEK